MSAERRPPCHVYGPVPSRRLGRSLGVDLVPLKVCSYDCVYCQLGRTTTKTTERREWVPLAEVLPELRAKLASAGPVDDVALAGSGEPTLHSGLGEVIRAVRTMTSAPIAVLTNGSLLFREDVRQDLFAADLVLPSLDVGDEELFRIVNRPAEGIPFERMVEGLVAFTREFRGEVWLEVLLLDGATEAPSQVAKIASLVGRIAPARVQLGTVARPPSELFAQTVSAARLLSIASLLPGRVEVLPPPGEPEARGSGERSAGTAEVLDLLRRRPCTAEDVAEGLALHRNEATKVLDRLTAAGEVRTVVSGGRFFFVPSGAGPVPEVRGERRSG
jgi:wyosine [tRNA(Phe)-imidazoG37] synthetase (radical SAM superfamily)